MRDASSVMVALIFRLLRGKYSVGIGFSRDSGESLKEHLTLGLLVPLLAYYGCSGETRPTDPGPLTGTLSGTVRNASDGQPVFGALIQITPSTRSALTDVQGIFQVHDIVLSANASLYTVTATKEGFEPTSLGMVLSPEQPRGTAEISLPPQDVALPGQLDLVLDVLKTVRNGPIEHGETFVFDVDLINTDSSVVIGVVVADTLDSHFGPVTREAIEIDSIRFPQARAIVDPGGQSFTVDLGTVPPTDDFVGAFSLTVRLPQANGVYCNRVWIRGGEGAPQKDTMCIADTQ